MSPRENKGIYYGTGKNPGVIEVDEGSRLIDVI